MKKWATARILYGALMSGGAIPNDYTPTSTKFLPTLPQYEGLSRDESTEQGLKNFGRPLSESPDDVWFQLLPDCLTGSAAGFSEDTRAALFPGLTPLDAIYVTSGGMVVALVPA